MRHVAMRCSSRGVAMTVARIRQQTRGSSFTRWQQLGMASTTSLPLSPRFVEQTHHFSTLSSSTEAKSAARPTITLTAPPRPWLESPVDLSAASFQDAKSLWEALGGTDAAVLEDDARDSIVSKIADKAFQLSVSTLSSARTADDLEESRSLLAIAVSHGNDRAKLYCGRLFLVGEWPVDLSSQQQQLVEEEIDKRSAKEKGMEVIRQIRAIQKKRKKGERFDSKPPKDVEQALQFFRSLASSGKDVRVRGDALLEMGDAHFFPTNEDTRKFVPEIEAVTAYTTAAEKYGTPGAWYRLGSALIETHHARAMECFQNAVEVEDDAEAHVILGHEFKSTAPSKAREHLERAAEVHNNSSAQVYLARWAMEEGDDVEAVRWLRRAEKLGDAEAAHLLADAHVQGTLGMDKDLPKALRLYKAAGQGGSEDAWLSAGAMAYDLHDFEDAFKCYEQAAEMGSMEAWKRMAHLYMTGQGVAESQETAERILKLISGEQ